MAMKRNYGIPFSGSAPKIYAYWQGMLGRRLPEILRSIVLLGLLVSSLPAMAGRPMATDDAGIVEDNACQLETWVQRSQDSAEYWAVPACNFTGNLELALGGTYTEGSATPNTLVMQGKTLFKPLETNSWGVGLVFGNQFTPGRSINGDLYAFVPVSFSFDDDRWLVHANLGWLRQREIDHHHTTWGIGVEHEAGKRTWLTLETFDQDQDSASLQMGFRHWLLTDRVQLDGTYGARTDTCCNEYWFSVGLKFVTVPFLP